MQLSFRNWTYYNLLLLVTIMIKTLIRRMNIIEILACQSGIINSSDSFPIPVINTHDDLR